MNQADQIEIVRHRRKLATNSLSREKESVVEHGHHSAMDHRYRIMDSQRTVSSVLTDCLIQGAHLSQFLEIDILPAGERHNAMGDRGEWRQQPQSPWRLGTG